MEWNELLIKRRSVRNFRDSPVSVELTKEIIKEACLAPSASNGQQWRFIVINNRDLMKRLSDESKSNILKTIATDPNHYSNKYEGVLKSPTFNVFYNAPCLVIIFGSKSERSTIVDCSLFASYFMLAAASRGLGTCWINLGSDIRDPKLLEEIGMPRDNVIVAPMILGYPNGAPPVPPRNEPVIVRIIG